MYVAGLLVVMIFAAGISVSEENKVMKETESDDQSLSNNNDTTAQNDPASFTKSRGGKLEWKYTASKGGMVSTPALVDLDNDGFLEIVFLTTGDEVIALNHDGSPRWINGNYVIEPASHLHSELWLSNWPTDLFSSITPVNVNNDSRTDIIFGAFDGLVNLDNIGVPEYTHSHSGRYYFSTPIVTDLEGDYSNIDMDGIGLSHYKDHEIVTGAVDPGRPIYLEAHHSTGGNIFDYTVQSPQPNICPITMGIAAGDLDGSMEDGGYYDGEEGWMELVFATNKKSMRIYERTGTLYNTSHAHNHPIYQEDTSVGVTGDYSYATPAVGNFSKKINSAVPEKLEIIIGKGGWSGYAWETPSAVATNAGLFCYDENGIEHWKALHGIIIASSPAVCDVQTLDKSIITKPNAEYEIFACNSHEGEIYCVAADDGSVLWSWQIDGAKSTSNRIFSSPAICNINSDAELEVVVGSDNGKVYCFDGDPSDGRNDGEEFVYPGEGTNFDLLWEFDTQLHGGIGKIGISSPVVADIDKDGELEVVIGDTGGTVWCISAGGTSVRGQQDWTMFHADLNNSGKYDPPK
jgi:outer membrane protein assembly factor BamB